MPPGATALTRTPPPDPGRPVRGRRPVQGQTAAPGARRMTEFGPTMPDIGDDVHDRAAIGLHPAVIDLAHEDEATGQIVAHEGLEPPGGDRLQRRAELTAGVVDQAVTDTVPLRN